MAADADSCYRHPGRSSWTLCQRCGRTICPECQILTPAGVRCPDCVKETGGSVRWESAAPKPPTAKKAPRRRPAPAREPREPSGAGGVLGQMFRPGGENPVASWAIIGTAVVLLVVGFVTSNLPFSLLAAFPETGIQVWRFVTAPVAYPALVSSIISILLSGLFFALVAPSVERTLGRRRFLVLAAVAAVVGSASMVLAGSVAYGLIGVLFGMFGAYLIFVWQYPPARIQALIVIGINLLFSLVLGGFTLPQIIGGLLAGAGATYLFQRSDDGRLAPRTARLILGGATAGFVLLAILRSLAF